MQQNRIQHRQKIISAETRVVGEKLISAVVSTENKDRDGDIIRQEGWDLDHFMKHPILLSSHDYGSLTNVIGEWKDMEVKGKQLIGTAEYYVGEGNDQADWGHNLASKGRAAYSVGFIPDLSKAKELKDEGSSWFPNYEFKGQELLEVSHVTVPSNRQALQQVKGFAKDPVIVELIEGMLADESPPEDDDELDKMVAALLTKTDAMYSRFAEDMEARLKTLQEQIDELQPEPWVFDPLLLGKTTRSAIQEAIRNGN